MLIFNTTFAVDRDRSHEFLLWLQQVFIPRVATDDDVEGTSLSTVVALEEGQEEDDATADSYCLQNAFQNAKTLKEWLPNVYLPALEEMIPRFGTSVQHFHTLLDEIPITPPN